MASRSRQQMAQRIARVALACGLGVLQGCSGGDVVAPSILSQGSAPVDKPVQSAPPRIIAIGPDTLVAGGTLAIEGEQFSGAAVVRITVAGVELPVRARSATRIEAALPVGAFPCAEASVQPVQVTVGMVTNSATRVLRTGVRLALEPGQSVSLLEGAQSRCVELAPAANGTSARYVLAVVNTSTTPGQVASFELRAFGTGTSEPTGGEVAPVGGASAGFGATPAVGPASVPRLMAAQRELEATQAGEAAHGALLSRQVQRARSGGSAAAAWQRAAAVKAGLPRAALTASPGTRVGDTLTLIVSHASCSAGRTVRGRVVYAGSRALVLEDIAAPRAGTMDQQYRQLGGEFDTVVYPLLTKNIGDPLAMNARLDGDGRVTMLFTRYVNDSLPGTAAFVNACNFYPRSTFAASNQDELFYGRVAGAWETPEDWRRSMRATVVHEAKHLASFAERMARGVEFEEPWLEEATARIAEELYARTFPGGGAWKGNVGFASSVGCELLQCDDRPLVMWKHFSGLHQFLRGADTLSPLAPASDRDNSFYASGWSLVRWVLDNHVGDEKVVLRKLVGGEIGVTGLGALTKTSDLSLDALALGWVLSNFEGGSLGASAASWNTHDVWSGLSATFPGLFDVSPARTAVAGLNGSGIELRLRALGSRYIEVGTTAQSRLVHIESRQPGGRSAVAVVRIQ